MPPDLLAEQRVVGAAADQGVWWLRAERSLKTRLHHVAATMTLLVLMLLLFLLVLQQQLLRELLVLVLRLVLVLVLVLVLLQLLLHGCVQMGQYW